MAEPLRVLVVDDQALVRHGLRQLLELEDQVRVVGEAADGSAALALLDGGVAVDVALVDARMPGMDGITLIAELRRRHPSVATLLLTTFENDELLFGSLSAGAGGFLLKDVEPDVLVQAIRSVAGRTLVVDDQMAPRLLARLQTVAAEQPSSDPDASLELLTERELEVARLVAAGASNREIARDLYLGEGTVKNHVSAVLRKLGLRDRTQLALAMRDR